MSRILLAMSGGVDSSVAAHLLRDAGHEVIGVFMRHGESTGTKCATSAGAAAGGLPVVERLDHKQGCCTASDAADARRVADRLGIPFYAIDFQQEFGRITRDYTATKDLYDSLLKRYDDAQVAESMELDKQGERFRILESAMPPSGPIAPDRPRLMILGMLFAGVAAVAAALTSEQFDSTFHSVDDLHARMLAEPVAAPRAS